MTDSRRLSITAAMLAAFFASTLLATPQTDPTPPATTSTATSTAATTSSSSTDIAPSSGSDSATSPGTRNSGSTRGTTRNSSAPEKSSTKSAPPPVKPSIMAASGPLNMLVDLSQRKLYVAIGKSPIKTFSVAVGTKAHPTPTGLFAVQHIVWNPSWRPPDAAWARGKSPAPPGNPDNPMKVVKLFFQEPDYYIHGTDLDDSLGGAASHGCIRMSESDVASLGRLIMDRGGAGKPDDWYAKVMNGTQSADIRLPRGIPFRITQ